MRDKRESIDRVAVDQKNRVRVAGDGKKLGGWEGEKPRTFYVISVHCVKGFFFRGGGVDDPSSRMT
jgi:hypothetical protein